MSDDRLLFTPADDIGSIGTCPYCGHFPSQFVDSGTETETWHIYDFSYVHPSKSLTWERDTGAEQRCNKIRQLTAQVAVLVRELRRRQDESHSQITEDILLSGAAGQPLLDRVEFLESANREWSKQAKRLRGELDALLGAGDND